MIELHRYEDGCVRVCLSDEGHTACATVSSDHLIEDKLPQLRRRIAKEKGALRPPK